MPNVATPPKKRGPKPKGYAARVTVQLTLDEIDALHAEQLASGERVLSVLASKLFTEAITRRRADRAIATSQ